MSEQMPPQSPDQNAESNGEQVMMPELGPAPVLEQPYPESEKPPSAEDIENFDKLIGSIIKSADQRFTMQGIPKPRGSKQSDEEWAAHKDDFWNKGTANEPSLREQLARQLYGSLRTHPQLKARLQSRFNQLKSGVNKDLGAIDDTQRDADISHAILRGATKALGVKEHVRLPVPDNETQKQREKRLRTEGAADIVHVAPDPADYRYYPFIKRDKAGHKVREFFLGDTRTPRGHRRAQREFYETHGNRITDKAITHAGAVIDASVYDERAAQAKQNLSQSEFRVETFVEVMQLVEAMPWDLVDRHEDKWNTATEHQAAVDTATANLLIDLVDHSEISAANGNAAADALNAIHSQILEVDELITSHSAQDYRTYLHLVDLRSNLAAMYLGGRYKYELVAKAVGQNRAAYNRDMSIELNDGSNVRLYPDGSYAKVRPGALVIDRRFADGTPWVEPQEVAMPEIDIDESMPISDLQAGQRQALTQWFDRPQDPAARRVAQQFSDELAHRLYEQIEEGEIDDPEALRQANIATYWGNYLHLKPGIDGSADPLRINPDGSIIEEHEYYGIQGWWTIGPDGSMDLYEDDGTGNWIPTRRFDPYGNERN